MMTAIMMRLMGVMMTMMQMDGGIDDGCDDDGDDAILPVALDTKLQVPVATKGLLGQNMDSPFDPAKLLGCKCMLTQRNVGFGPRADRWQ